MPLGALRRQDYEEREFGPNVRNSSISAHHGTEGRRQAPIPSNCWGWEQTNTAQILTGKRVAATNLPVRIVRPACLAAIVLALMQHCPRFAWAEPSATSTSANGAGTPAATGGPSADTGGKPKSTNTKPRPPSTRETPNPDAPNASRAGTSGGNESQTDAKPPRASGAAPDASAASKRTATARASTATATSKNSKQNRTGNKANTRSGSASSSEARRVSKEGTGKADTTATDPELSALVQAEKVLFPWALRGLKTGYEMDDPFAYSGSAASIAGASASTAWMKDLVLPPIFPNIDGRIVTYLEFYRSTAEGKSILRTWAKKRGRYESAIAAALTKAGAPTELVWQSMIESGHNPSIRSPAGAAGLWQFMPDTARLYGLVVDRWIDERLDPESSTLAAGRMMADLFQRFGNWELALAAYNMGEAGLLRSIRKYNTNDFWTLSRYEAGIPRETALYVPRVIALTVAMSNPSAFGIADIAPDEPLKFDTVSLAPGQPLSTLARLIGITEDELYRINPHLLAQRVPPSVSSDKARARIFLPPGKVELARARVARLSGLEPDLMAYCVRMGESLDAIANARGVGIDMLRSINRMAVDERIEPGVIVLVPKQGSEPVDARYADEDRVAVVPPNMTVPNGQRRVFYRTKNGDNLSSIADAFGISRADLLAYNSLDPSARIQPRMLLQLYVQRDARLEGLSFLEEKDVNVLVAGSPEFGEYFEGLRGNERIVIQVRPKDTLAAIGKKYGVSIGSMERINQRSRNDPLVPGESIVVYTRRTGSSDRLSSAR